MGSRTLAKTRKTTNWVDPESFDTTDEDMRYGHDIRWKRTGIRNAEGYMILRRIDLPIGFRANHAMPTYSFDEDDLLEEEYEE